MADYDPYDVVEVLRAAVLEREADVASLNGRLQLVERALIDGCRQLTKAESDLEQARRDLQSALDSREATALGRALRTRNETAEVIRS